MKTFLFTWNPQRWPWEHLENDIQEFSTIGKISHRWNCQSHKSINIGDRVFFIRLGRKKPGMIGSGYVTSLPFLSEHFDGSGKLVSQVMIEFEDLLERNADPIIPMAKLKSGNLIIQNWSTQASGIEIRPEILEELEDIWFNYSFKSIKINSTKNKYTEGLTRQSFIAKYERNPHARKECLDYYGYSCQVCEINFEQSYGEIGREFIHVHHLTKISTIGESYIIDPIADLRPLCPNCHSMIHKRKDPYTINELKEIYKENTNH